MRRKLRELGDEDAKLTAGIPVERFGCAVGLDKKTAIAGAPFCDHAGEDAGSAHIFKRIGDRATAGLTRALDGAPVA